MDRQRCKLIKKHETRRKSGKMINGEDGQNTAKHVLEKITLKQAPAASKTRYCTVSAVTMPVVSEFARTARLHQLLYTGSLRACIFVIALELL